MKASIFFLLLMTSTLVSCGTSNSDTLTIKEAKNFYETFRKGVINQQYEKDNYIFWEDFKVFKDKKGQSYLFVTFVNSNSTTVTIEDPRQANNTRTMGPSSLVFTKDNGEILAYKTSLIMDDNRYRKSVDDQFSGYVTLYDLVGNVLEVVLFDDGKLTYSSKNSLNNTNPVNICFSYPKTAGGFDRYCIDVYSVKEVEQSNFLGSILQPYSQAKISPKSFENYIEFLTPDSLKAQGKRVQLVPDN